MQFSVFWGERQTNTWLPYLKYCLRFPGKHCSILKGGGELGQRRQWQPTPVLLPGESHGWRSLVGYSPWGCEESDMIERLHFHFSLSWLEKEMATHSSILVWRIPGTEEPVGLPSIGSHRVRQDWRDLAAAEAGGLGWVGGVGSSKCIDWQHLQWSL